LPIGRILRCGRGGATIREQKAKINCGSLQRLLLHSIEPAEKEDMKVSIPKSVALVALSAAVVHAADAKVSRQQADSFQQKIMVIAVGADAPTKVTTPRRIALTESELNSWFAYHAQPLIPAGVADPKISIIGDGKLGAEAIVDLDAVAKRKATGGVLDPWSYIGGRVPVTVIGILHTKDGIGRFQLESAEVSGVPVPKTLLQELVAYYSRTENHPNGINVEAPFELPAGIHHIEVGQGQAVVVQ